MRYLVCSILLGLVMTGPAANSAGEQFNIIVEPVLDRPSSLFNGSGCSGFWTEADQAVVGKMYAGKKSWGVQSGLVRSDDSALVEIPYSVVVTRTPDGLSLIGTVYFMHFAEDRDALPARRILINEPIILLRPILVSVGPLPDGSFFSLQFTISHERQDCRSCLTLPLRLVSVASKDGSIISRHGAGRPFGKFPQKFETRFTSPVENQPARVLDYQALLNLKPDPSTLTEDGPVDLEFIRRYLIRAYQNDEWSVSSRAQYTSTYSRRLRLDLNKTLKIVIPADTPSVQGFTIEDTLIITAPGAQDTGQEDRE